MKLPEFVSVHTPNSRLRVIEGLNELMEYVRHLEKRVQALESSSYKEPGVQYPEHEH